MPLAWKELKPLNITGEDTTEVYLMVQPFSGGRWITPLYALKFRPDQFLEAQEYIDRKKRKAPGKQFRIVQVTTEVIGE